jgi:hypothetical protein
MEIRYLRILVYKRNLFWISILESEGVPFQVIEDLTVLDSFIKDQVLILWNEAISSDETVYLASWIGRGNVLISQIDLARKFKSHDEKCEISDYSVSDFSRTVGDDPDKNVKTFFKRSGKGYIVGLFFKIESYWLNTRKSYKKICLDITTETFTKESLNSVVKYNIRKYIRTALLRSYQFLEMPLVFIWRFPEDKANVINLRVDVDPDRKTESGIANDRIDKTFKQSIGNEDRTTFFINFYKRRGNLDFIRDYINYGFDIQNHNYFHCLYPTFSHNLRNFELGHQILARNDIIPVGFSSPEYFWYNNTMQILDKFNYKYSHSFGLDYNNYPYRPVISGTLAKYLEIPNDPLVYSKLVNTYKGISAEMVSNFYIQSLQDKLNSYDIPCIKYEHPNILGEYPIIMDKIYSFFNQLENVVPITLTEWAIWLHKRNELVNNIKVGYYHDSFSNTVQVNLSEFSGESSDFGIGLQFNETEILVKKFSDNKIQELKVSEFKKYTIKKNQVALNMIFYDKDEKKINVWRSKRHLKKLVNNYRLYYQYKKKKFYL